MRFMEKRTSLRDGRECVLRSPETADAEAMLDYLYKTSQETDYLVRYPEEAVMSIEQEEDFLNRVNAEDMPDMMITAWVDGRMAGAASVNQISGRIKMRHRASLGIAILKEYWGIGLGNILMLTALREAKNMGYYQLELGVFADNGRAIALYGKMGFETWGTTKNAFRLKDGTMVDEIIMGKIL